MMNGMNSLLCKVEIRFVKFARKVLVVSAFLLACAAGPSLAQKVVAHDPAEPPSGKPQAKIVARPAGRIVRQTVDEKGMRSLISELVGCGTRLTLSSWSDPKRGIGCARDQIAARMTTISKETGGERGKCAAAEQDCSGTRRIARDDSVCGGFGRRARIARVFSLK